MEKKDHLIKINGAEATEVAKLEEGKIRHLGGDRYRIHYKSQNIDIRLTESAEKRYTVKIKGFTYDLQVLDDLDMLIERLGFNQSKSNFLKEIKAPMPGLVLDVFVGKGDVVHEGDKLVVLEAMKMENMIKAEGAGTVDEVFVKKGDKVDKGQIFISFE